MSGPHIRARVYAGPQWIFHLSDEGAVTSPSRGHRYCTARCRPLRTWYYEVSLGDQVISTDNTGSWRPIFDAANEQVKTIRQTIGVMAKEQS